MQKYLDLTNDTDFSYARHLWARYRLTDDHYNEILARQGRVCGICGTDSARSKNKLLVVDHDHATDRVRGLLCSPCNQAVGVLGDDIRGVYRALRYLLDHHGINSIQEYMEGKKLRCRVYVEKPKGRGNYYYRYRLPGKKWDTKKTSHTNNYSEAFENAKQLEAELNASLGLVDMR